VDVRVVAVLVSFGLTVLAGCSGGDDAAPAPTASPTSGGASVDATTGPASSEVPATAATTSTAPATIPEVGIPGLDSDEAVCSAWSRFAGSFQVVAVAASFGDGAAALEVVAAPTVVRAFDDLLAAWPDELASEREVVEDEFLGPFAARARVARSALVDAGADDVTIERIESAWLDALAQRRPDSPDLVVDLDEDVWALVDVAAADLEAALPPVPADPSLVTDAEVPLTEAYLAATCPDQGTLAGQDPIG
jgi:hypothetical protein